MIRPARLEDASAMANVQFRAYHETYGSQWPETYLASLDQSAFEADWNRRLSQKDPQKIYLAADCENQIVGFASGGKISEQDPDFASELYTLYLLQKAQRHGLGKRLFANVTDFLKEQGFNTMLCWVHSTNKSAQGFYEAMGGQRAREKMSSRVPGMMMYAYGWQDLEAIA